VLLSRSLPLRAGPYGPTEARPYFEGLLPDGMRRERLARELGLEHTDAYGLLAELGRDCLGAVVLLPSGERPEPPSDPGSLAWLGEDELEELLAIPPPRLLDPDRPERMRFALPGERHKLALVRDEASGRWAWPQPGAPSTHILKPETGEYPDFVVNEVACTAAMREVGFPVAPLELKTIAGRPCAVSERFDRTGEGAGATRLHQETFWQALGIPPGAERNEPEAERPGFQHSAELLRQIGAEAEVETLFRFGFCNFLLGNHPDEIVKRRDLHGRNSALLLDPEGGASLAPFCDIASTGVYEDDSHMARTIVEWVEHTSGYAGLMRIGMECERVPLEAVITAVRLAADLTQGLGSVARRALDQGWYRPVIDEVVLVVTKRAEQLSEDLSHVVKGPHGETLPRFRDR
jgi:serine/threonine-protein kinase HipA